MTECRHDSSVVFLIQEVSGLLTVCDIHAQLYAVLKNSNHSFSALSYPSAGFRKTFLVAYVGIIPFVNKIRLNRLLKCLKDFRTEPVACHGKELNYKINFSVNITVTFTDEARNKICLCKNKPV